MIIKGNITSHFNNDYNTLTRNVGALRFLC
jgi:hypothetical protein